MQEMQIHLENQKRKENKEAFRAEKSPDKNFDKHAKEDLQNSPVKGSPSRKEENGDSQPHSPKNGADKILSSLESDFPKIKKNLTPPRNVLAQPSLDLLSLLKTIKDPTSNKNSQEVKKESPKKTNGNSSHFSLFSSSIFDHL